MIERILENHGGSTACGGGDRLHGPVWSPLEFTGNLEALIRCTGSQRVQNWLKSLLCLLEAGVTQLLVNAGVHVQEGACIARRIQSTLKSGLLLGGGVYNDQDFIKLHSIISNRERRRYALIIRPAREFASVSPK